MSAELATLTVGARHPVMELFGPTIQGEGPDAGRPCVFVRFGGCDYRCSWCDSMHAVEPSAVRRDARRLSDAQIIDELLELAGDRPGLLVVLSGGNPALFELADLVGDLQTAGMRVSVETQGSVWRDWLALVDRLVVSPKPPSSGMTSPRHRDRNEQFLERAVAARAASTAPALKVVCFDEVDVEFALGLWESTPGPDGARLPLYLSAGTDVDREPTPQRIAERFRWLCEHAATEPRAQDAVVLPQLHVIAWGTEKGR